MEMILYIIIDKYKWRADIVLQNIMHFINLTIYNNFFLIESYKESPIDS